MNEDNSIQPQEDKLISQAKKRLLGASVILFILLISAPFVLKNRNDEGPTEPIKISMESTPENVDVNVESIKPPETKQEITESSISPIKKEALPPSDVKTKSEVVTTSNSGIYIQLGIFSDNEKIKSLQQKLNQLNIQTKSETIKVNGTDKIRLITDEFKTEALAKEVLIKIKNAGITGIIKKTS
ncbi:SPOR domain-containing protein [Candidatus Methylopumilus universalis]|jgi:cell division septation protein DedD|uniref:SPOR domain-containing protein n=1 Tax=Candidatus Methylopumilus universalis TaxID=2588536 RepID=UPI00111D044D|nr:SPOR domain-containing protein [Candidatus Methylopumilus universalis]QDC78908.1 SPOR domain-containing protein [Candidatus Methylopumilus universalis]